MVAGLLRKQCELLLARYDAGNLTYEDGYEIGVDIAAEAIGLLDENARLASELAAAKAAPAISPGEGERRRSGLPIALGVLTAGHASLLDPTTPRARNPKWKTPPKPTRSQ